MKRETDEKLEKQRAMMDWQLAKATSDSEEDSDDELDREDDITK